MFIANSATESEWYSPENKNKTKEKRLFFLIGINWLSMLDYWNRLISNIFLFFWCPNSTHFICTEFCKSFVDLFSFIYFYSCICYFFIWFHLFVFTTSNQIDVVTRAFSLSLSLSAIYLFLIFVVVLDGGMNLFHTNVISNETND